MKSLNSNCPKNYLSLLLHLLTNQFLNQNMMNQYRLIFLKEGYKILIPMHKRNLNNW